MNAYVAYPDDPEPFKRRERKPRETSWVSPFHARDASRMKRAYRLDHKGNPMKELGRELVLDPLPSILKQEKKKIFSSVDNLF